MAGAQLLLLARGEQQRVVDPGAEPEHAGEGGGEAGDLRDGRRPEQDPEAEPDPRERRQQRVARRTQAPQHGDQQHDRDGQPGQLADREAAGRGAVDDLARELDLHARAVRRLLELLARVAAEVLGRAVVGDGGVRRAAVVGELRLLDADDVGEVADAIERAGQRAAVELTVEDDGRLGARLAGEALLQQVLGLLRLDARNAEVVLEPAAGGDGAADQRDDREQEGEGGEPWPAAGQGGEFGEHGAEG